jgi:hypothetical protein
MRCMLLLCGYASAVSIQGELRQRQPALCLQTLTRKAAQGSSDEQAALSQPQHGMGAAYLELGKSSVLALAGGMAPWEGGLSDKVSVHN